MVLVIPGVAFATAYDSTLTLDNKYPDTWGRIGDGISGTLQYNLSGATFDFSLSATGLEDVQYSLIYYANPWPGNNPGKLIDTGIAVGGSLIMSGSPNLNMNLPTPPDSNMVVPHNVPPDNYAHAYGAKIWLVPSDCYDGTKITVWSPTRFLFETDLITYTDTNLASGTVVTTTTTVTEPTATIGLTVAPLSLGFGCVAIGSCSAELPITLTNTGDVPIKVIATTSAGFYTDCMKLALSGGTYYPASGWISTTIPVGSALTIYTKVCPTIAYSGTITGSVSFVASFAP